MQAKIIAMGRWLERTIAAGGSRAKEEALEVRVKILEQRIAEEAGVNG